MTSRREQLAIAIVWGLSCHCAFIAGVGAMIVAMFFGMSRSLGTLPQPWSYLTNAVLLLQFPLLHSWFLSGPGRRFLSTLAPVPIGSRLTTTTYAFIASIQTGLLFVLWSPTGAVWWQAQGFFLALITCLYAAAWLLLLQSIIDAGFAFQTGLLGWWAVVKNVAPTYPGMPVRGLFRLCRQPIYVSFALTLWTVPTWTPDQLAVATTLTLYCMIGPLFKEARFLRLFGESFADYRRKVPYLPYRWPQKIK
jgi:methanethiol S-methyltransferase